MVTERTSGIGTRRLHGLSAAVGLVLTCLPLVGNYAAFSMGYPKLGNACFGLGFWPLVIFVPLLNWLGFDNYWIPHPLAFILALGFALTIYSVLTYAILKLWARMT